jgi:lipopolysaccharide biosynthesis glycosyltransferase
MFHVACAADEGYIPHCAAMLNSLLAHNSEIVVHFLHGPSMDKTLIAQLKQMVSVENALFQSHEMADECLVGLPRLRNIPTLMWYRVYLPELLPDIDRILYVDADTLIMRELSELRSMDLAGCYVAAVENVFEKTLVNWPAQLGLPQAAGYFNSGVLLLNLEAMRIDNVCEKILEVGRASPVRLKWPDQDALNKVLGESRINLHPSWNCQSSLFYYPEAKELFGSETVKEAIRNPAIVHFEGGIKPWHFLCKHPYQKAYISHRNGTPWPVLKLDGISIGARVLRLLPMVWIIQFLKVAYGIRGRLSRFRRRLA